MKPAKGSILLLGLALLAAACGRQEPPKELRYSQASPAFSVAYPDQWKPEKPRYAGEVFRVTDPTALPSLAVSVYGSTGPQIISEKYGENFVGALKALFPRASDYKLLSSKVVALADGTPAAEVACEWTWEDGATRLASFNLSAVKDNNLVSITCTGLQGTSADQLARYPRTLGFGK